MERLYFIASVIFFLTVIFTECHGENFLGPQDIDQGQTATLYDNTPEVGKLPNILDRIKLLSGKLVPRNVKELFSKEEKNTTDHISVGKIEKLDPPQLTLDEKHREPSEVKGHVGVHGSQGISSSNNEDLSRVPRQSPSNTAAYQERLQQQIRDNPEQAQKIKELQADAQARYQQAMDSERAKMFAADSEQGQKLKEKFKEGRKNKEGGKRNKEGGMKKLKERKGKGGKGKERTKGSRKGSGEGKKEKGERKNKLKSGMKKGKGDREGKRKKNKGDRTRGHGGTKGQASANESI